MFTEWGNDVNSNQCSGGLISGLGTICRMSLSFINPSEARVIWDKLLQHLMFVILKVLLNDFRAKEELLAVYSHKKTNVIFEQSKKSLKH